MVNDMLSELILEKKLRGKRLKTLARFIEEHLGLKTEIVEGYCNTDRHIPGTRLRHVGKGRYGNKLIIKDQKEKVVFEHNSAETYRYNGEVVDWIIQKLNEE